MSGRMNGIVMYIDARNGNVVSCAASLIATKHVKMS